jgi:hypothetical protein
VAAIGFCPLGNCVIIRGSGEVGNNMAGKTTITLFASVLLLGCASTERRELPRPDGAAIKATAVRLLQASNADRLQQLQVILREQSLAYDTQAVPNPSRRGDTRTEGHNVLVAIGYRALAELLRELDETQR